MWSEIHPFPFIVLYLLLLVLMTMLWIDISSHFFFFLAMYAWNELLNRLLCHTIYMFVSVNVFAPRRSWSWLECKLFLIDVECSLIQIDLASVVAILLILLLLLYIVYKSAKLCTVNYFMVFTFTFNQTKFSTFLFSLSHTSTFLWFIAVVALHCIAEFYVAWNQHTSLLLTRALRLTYSECNFLHANINSSQKHKMRK